MFPKYFLLSLIQFFFENNLLALLEIMSSYFLVYFEFATEAILFCTPILAQN